MTLKQMTAARELAQNPNEDLTDTDMTHLYGCGLPDFKPVYTTLRAVARHMAYQCAQLNGGWDFEEFQSVCHIARKKFIII